MTSRANFFSLGWPINLCGQTIERSSLLDQVQKVKFVEECRGMSAANKGTASKGAGSGGKSKGSHLPKHSKAGSKKQVTEADLLSSENITPEDVLSLERATEGKETSRL